MQYLYLIRSQSFYKIGIANDVKSRLSQLQTGNPFPLELVACYDFEDAAPVERVLHMKFDSCRGRGEWFTLDDEKISVFHSICTVLDGRPSDDAPFHLLNEEIEEAEEAQETQDILLSGIDWRLDRRNGRGYAIFQRGGEKKYIGYVGKNSLKDWEHPTVEEIEAAIAKFKAERGEP